MEGAVWYSESGEIWGSDLTIAPSNISEIMETVTPWLMKSMSADDLLQSNEDMSQGYQNSLKTRTSSTGSSNGCGPSARGIHRRHSTFQTRMGQGKELFFYERFSFTRNPLTALRALQFLFKCLVITGRVSRHCRSGIAS